MAPKPAPTSRPIDIVLPRPRPAISVAIAVANYGPCRYQYSACSDTERWGGAVEAESVDAAFLGVFSGLRETCNAERMRFVVQVPARSTLWDLRDEIAQSIPGIWIERPTSHSDKELVRQANAGLDEAKPTPALATAQAAATHPMCVATDGSVRGKFTGCGWLASSGEYDLRGFRHSKKQIGPNVVLVAELRAIGMAVQELRGRDITVLSDSKGALDMVRRWTAGDDELPRGYTLCRDGGKTPGLVRAQQMIFAERENITLMWVKGHRGEPLNEGADALARLASRYALGNSGLDATECRRRAEGLAESFSREFNSKRTAVHPANSR